MQISADISHTNSEQVLQYMTEHTYFHNLQVPQVLLKLSQILHLSMQFNQFTFERIVMIDGPI